MTRETIISFNGLIGPTHNYSGLSAGNIASTSHKGNVSNPKGAALEGIEKMRLLQKLGMKQGVLPPQRRPHIPTLHALGFLGGAEEVLKKAVRDAPYLLQNVSSGSSMWAANAATVTPSSDSGDKKVHITPANLSSKFHRSIEADQTAKILKAIFPDPLYFVHHAPLPRGRYFADEGSANHIRLGGLDRARGVNLFAFGRRSFAENALTPTRFAARASLEGQEAIARLHGLDSRSLFFMQQHPQGIDKGVFHNDVIALGCDRFLLVHEKAYVGQEIFIAELKKTYKALFDEELVVMEATEEKLPLQDAVSSYFYNAEMIVLGPKTFSLVVPQECREVPSVATYIETLIKDPDSPLEEVHYVSLKESMQNGGGPACLRLPVPLTEAELSKVHPSVLVTDKLLDRLVEWVQKHYRERLEPKDLQDAALLKESDAALDALEKILDLEI